jgi:alpha-tubulin suppressor-like RCC1 family protein
MRTRVFLGWLACSSAALAAAACVGDDPAPAVVQDGDAATPPPPPPADSGADGQTPPGDAGGDAASDRVVQVAAGARSSCALYASGAVYCWGDNIFGELGIGTAGTDHVQPTLVPLTRPAIRISVGTYSGCAVEDDNSLWCWGDNQSGDIGELPDASPACGARPCELAPILIPSLKVKDVALGFHFGCAIAVDGHLACWGKNGASQAALDPATEFVDPPSLVATLPSVKTVKFGYQGHTACAIDTGGAVWCWGWNNEGQLGHAPGAGTPADEKNGPTYSNATPQKVPLPGPAVDLVAAATICAVTDDGSVYCWGRNAGAELANGGPSAGAHPAPTKVPVTNATSIAGSSAFCALAGAGQPFCWGANAFAVGSPVLDAGGCTNSSDVSETCRGVGPVTGGPAFTAISVGDDHVVGLTADGAVYSWGNDQYGRVNPADAGADSGIFVAVPSRVAGLP